MTTHDETKNPAAPEAHEPDAQEMRGIRQALIDNLNGLREMGVDPYPPSCERGHTVAQARESGAGATHDPAGEPVKLCGRLVAIRGMGKSTFGHLEDGTGRIQFLLRKDVVAEAEVNAFKKARVGDFAQISGPLFLTKTGELTVHVQSFAILSKAIRPMPEKWHGLKDPELRSRKRYLDLMVNPESRERFVKRSKILAAIRARLADLGFLEVDTPVLQPIYGGAAARPFETFHNALSMDLYLRIAPELYLKRLLVGMLEKVYEVARVFRNEGISTRHNPEFTMLELYQAYADFRTMMDITEDLIVSAREAVSPEPTIAFGEHSIRYARPFRRLTMAQACVAHGGIAEADTGNAEALRARLKAAGVEFEPADSPGVLLNLLFEEVVQPHLIEPTFVYDYPVEVSPLAKRHRSIPGMTERFELFVAGQEIANAFSELNDPLDQRGRFESQLAVVDKKGENIREIDEDYLEAMEHGMPPAGGLGIGIDRLVMLLTGETNIREILLFPLHRKV